MIILTAFTLHSPCTLLNLYLLCRRGFRSGLFAYTFKPNNAHVRPANFCLLSCLCDLFDFHYVYLLALLYFVVSFISLSFFLFGVGWGPHLIIISPKDLISQHIHQKRYNANISCLCKLAYYMQTVQLLTKLYLWRCLGRRLTHTQTNLTSI